MPWLLDLVMLVQLDGRERTQEQYQALLDRTGYTLDRVTPLPSAGAPGRSAAAWPAARSRKPG